MLLLRRISPRLAARLATWRADIAIVRAQYRHWHGGRDPKLFAPRRYTEKVQWRKLFDLDPRYAVVSDKAAARGFVSARLGADAQPPLLWLGADPDAIPFDTLLPPYVIKSTHASGDLIMVGRDEIADVAMVRRATRSWVERRYRPDETAYALIPPRIIVERQVTVGSGHRPIERRVFVFAGRAQIINTVFVEDGSIRNGYFETADGVRLAWHFTRPPQAVAAIMPGARRQMIDWAERLAAGFDHLRVDFFDLGDHVLVGEITVYPWAGAVPFVPDGADLAFGRLWPIRQPRLRAVWTMLTRDRAIRPPAPSA